MGFINNYDVMLIMLLINIIYWRRHGDDNILTSIQRYSDSNDMLTWLGNGDDDDDFGHHYQHRRPSRTRDRHVNELHDNNNNNTMVSDSHYHNCEDKPANQSLALQPLPRNEDNQEFDGWVGSCFSWEDFIFIFYSLYFYYKKFYG